MIFFNFLLQRYENIHTENLVNLVVDQIAPDFTQENITHSLQIENIN